ncbi:MAG: type II secretion system protein [Gammaproteobacteria bacterium]
MNSNSCQRGVSYTEVLVAIVLISLIALPTAQSIQSALTSARQSIDDANHRFALQSLLETTLVDDFASLSSRAGGSTTPAASSALADGETLDLYIASWDIDNADGDDDPFSGADDEVLWVRVQLRGTRLTLSTLVTR